MLNQNGEKSQIHFLQEGSESQKGKINKLSCILENVYVIEKINEGGEKLDFEKLLEGKVSKASGLNEEPKQKLRSLVFEYQDVFSD